MLVETHLIITDQFDEYEVKWCGKLIDSNPVLNKDGLPTFILITNDKHFEFETFDIDYVVKQAKKFTKTKGKEAYTTGKSYIYIKQKNDKDKLLGVVYRYHTRKFAPMFDDIPI